MVPVPVQTWPFYNGKVCACLTASTLTGLLLQSKPVTLWETKSDLNWSFKLAYQCLGAKETNVTRNWDESVQVFFLRVIPEMAAILW